MQKRNLLTLSISASFGVLLMVSAVLPISAHASDGHANSNSRVNANLGSLASDLGDQIRDLVKQKIDTKKEEICDRFEDRIQSRFPGVRGPSFCRHGGDQQTAPTVSISADPMTVTVGENTTVSWDSTDANSCTASGGWSGSKDLSGSDSIKVNATTTYTLACTNAAGTTSRSVTVNATPVVVPSPTVSLSASPMNVEEGATSTLTWSSTNANTCLASDGWSGTQSLSGNMNVTLNATTTYTLACGNGMATDTKSVTVNAIPTPVPTPTLTLNASPLAIIAGATSTLTWSSADSDSCTASNGWSGAMATSGNEIVSPLATTTYSLSCVGGGGATSSAVTIGVTPTSSPTQNIGHMVISEVYYDVATTTGETQPANEWFELYNGSTSPIDINGWTIKDSSTSFDTLATTSTIVPSKGYVVVTDSTSTLDFWSIPSPVIFLDSSIGRGLGDSGDSLTLFDNASTTVDSVEWGNSTTTPMDPSVPNVSKGHSIGRIQFTADTDTSADWGDFASPTPGM
jgi:hypothetical protein